MEALVYKGPKTVNVENIKEPIPREGQVRVKVLYCGVCGSDIGIYSGLHPRVKPPLIIGHEFVGIIEDEDETNGDFKIGDRVVAYPLVSCGKCYACRTGQPHVCDTLKLIGIDLDGGMAEYVNCDSDALFKLPENVPDIVGAIVEPLAVAIHAVHRAGFKTLDSAVIIGAGPIGLLIGIVLKHSGASNIIMSDIDDSRLRLCNELGFDTVNSAELSVVNYTKEKMDGQGVNICFECAGVNDSARDMTGVCSTDGTICLVGVHKKPTEVNLADMHFRELKLVATRVYEKEEFKQAVAYTQVCRNDLEKIISHCIPLKNADSIFDIIRDKKENAMKVIVDCR